MQRFEVAVTVEELQVQGDTANASVEVVTEATLGSDPRLSTRRADHRYVRSDGDWLLVSAHVLEGNEDWT